MCRTADETDTAVWFCLRRPWRQSFSGRSRRCEGFLSARWSDIRRCRINVRMPTCGMGKKRFQTAPFQSRRGEHLATEQAKKSYRGCRCGSFSAGPKSASSLLLTCVRVKHLPFQRQFPLASDQCLRFFSASKKPLVNKRSSIRVAVIVRHLADGHPKILRKTCPEEAADVVIGVTGLKRASTGHRASIR